MKKYVPLLLIFAILSACSSTIRIKNDIHETFSAAEDNYYVVTGNLINIRKGPSHTSDLLGVVNKGSIVLVIDENYDDTYAKIRYDGKDGYIMSRFIRKQSENDIESTKKEIVKKEIVDGVENSTKIKETPKNKSDLTSENYPRVDGSTANMPLMAQIRSDVLSENLMVSQNKTSVTTTDFAWRRLLDGNCDLLLVYEASSETKKIIEESDTKLIVTPIGVDALVFIENEKNIIDNLTTKQIQEIYTGITKNWKDVGGADIEIQAFQRPLNSGSQTLFLNLVMRGIKPKTPLKSEEPAEMDGLIDVIASYNNSANAIGYSVFYYAKKMYQVPGLKLISVDGIAPSDETIGNGTYPYLNKYYLVIREDTPEDSPTKKLYDYILSERGKESLIKAGYIPVS